MKPEGRFEEIFRCGGDSQDTNRILQIIAAVFSGMVGGIVITDPDGAAFRDALARHCLPPPRWRWKSPGRE